MNVMSILIKISLALILLYLLLRVILNVLIRCTGNEYRKVDGVLWVKHPNGNWIKLSEHENKQKELRENK